MSKSWIGFGDNGIIREDAIIGVRKHQANIYEVRTENLAFKIDKTQLNDKARTFIDKVELSSAGVEDV